MHMTKNPQLVQFVVETIQICSARWVPQAVEAEAGFMRSAHILYCVILLQWPNMPFMCLLKNIIHMLPCFALQTLVHGIGIHHLRTGVHYNTCLFLTGTTSNTCYSNITVIGVTLGESACDDFTGAHSFTACGSTSVFKGRG